MCPSPTVLSEQRRSVLREASPGSSSCRWGNGGMGAVRDLLKTLTMGGVSFPRHLTDSWRTSVPFLWVSPLLVHVEAGVRSLTFSAERAGSWRSLSTSRWEGCWAPGLSLLRAQHRGACLGSVFSDHWASPMANTLVPGPASRSLLPSGAGAGSLRDSSLPRAQCTGAPPKWAPGAGPAPVRKLQCDRCQRGLRAGWPGSRDGKMSEFLRAHPPGEHFPKQDWPLRMTFH